VGALADLYRALPGDVGLLARLVAIGSPPADGAAVTRVQRELVRVLEPLGMACELVPEPARGSHLLARTPAAQRSPRSIFLVAHADTVHAVNPESDRLQVEGRIPDMPEPEPGTVLRAFGPGSLDLKGGLVCVTAALRQLGACGALDALLLTFFVNACEEDSTEHSAEFIRHLAGRATAALVFEFGRDGDRIVTQRKGLRSYRLEVSGRSAHSGALPNPADNAIARLCRIAAEFGQLADPARGVSVNLGKIGGGSQVNVVAERAWLEFEVRAPTEADLDRVEYSARQIAEHADNASRVRLARTSAAPPMRESAGSAELYESYARHGRALGLGCERAPLQGGLGDANLFAAEGVPTIDGLGPWGQNPHARDEFVNVCSIPPKAANLVEWLMDRGPAGCGPWCGS
jgi:glutamate carboxypeptidase